MSGPGPSRRHGYLVIDKPAGWTSHDVVARVRRIVGERRVGHAGTLDPAAVGVLPLAVGNATRTIEFLAGADKSYQATITLGIETDSHDTDGVVLRREDASGVTRAAVEDALARFQGEVEQVPPMHSAVQVAGKRLYELARRGETIERAARPVTITRLDLVAWEPPNCTLLIDCSKGTYVRSLTRDLGEALSVGAVLAHLVRLRSGPFTLDDAMSLEHLARIIDVEPWETIAHRSDMPLRGHPAVVLDGEAARRWQQGNVVTSTSEATGIHRVYDEAGVWLGIGEQSAATHQLRPVKVISAA